MLLNIIMSEIWKDARRLYTENCRESWIFACCCVLFRPSGMTADDILTAVCASFGRGRADFLLSRGGDPVRMPEDFCAWIASIGARTASLTARRPAAYLPYFDAMSGLARALADNTAHDRGPWMPWVEPHLLPDRRDSWFDDLAGALGLWRVPRSGWRQLMAREGRSDEAAALENVAAHSVKTAVIAAAMAGEDKRWRVFLTALCHDWAELKIGDLTPRDGVTAREKHAAECAAYPEIMAEIPVVKSQKMPIETKFLEYDAMKMKLIDENAARDPDAGPAILVHLADKLDMLIQAVCYRSLLGAGFSEIIDSAHRELLWGWRRLCLNTHDVKNSIL